MAQLLVVEDNADILHLIWTQMRARGHEVLGASSGPEALAAVELWGPPQVGCLMWPCRPWTDWSCSGGCVAPPACRSSPRLSVSTCRP
jgi:hypothetical protein